MQHKYGHLSTRKTNVQRRTTHLVKCIKHLSYSERLKTLGLPTLEHRGPVRFLVDLGYISVYFLPNICFFRPICVPNQPKNAPGPYALEYQGPCRQDSGLQNS